METPIYQFESMDFNGPLDVLLSLIEKHKLDIHDLPISTLLDQYTEFIRHCEEQNWSLTADFIEMTARLMYIKSYTLLPPSADGEEEDPKQELEHLLQEYAKYKSLSEELRSQYVGNSIFFRETTPDDLPKPPANYNYVSDKLQAAYRRILIKYSSQLPDKGKLSTIISTSYVSVTSRLNHLTYRFRAEKKIDFEHVFEDCSSRSEIIATFLAILELLRDGQLNIEAEGDRISLFVIEDDTKE